MFVKMSITCCVVDGNLILTREKKDNILDSERIYTVYAWVKENATQIVLNFKKYQFSYEGKILYGKWWVFKTKKFS